MNIDYDQKIPNNVDLSSDKALQRALEHWQPEFLSWWKLKLSKLVENENTEKKTSKSKE